MIFLDAEGKEMTPEEVREAGAGHLLDDAPRSRCETCGRTSWDRAETVCGMTQPDGSRCGGRLLPQAAGEGPA